MSENNLISTRVTNILGDKTSSKQDVTSLINTIVDEIKAEENSLNNLGKFKSIKLPRVPINTLREFIKPNQVLQEKMINFFKATPDSELTASVISTYAFLTSMAFSISIDDKVRFFTFPLLEKTVMKSLQITAPTYKQAIYVLVQRNLVNISLYSAVSGIVYELK